MAQKTRANLKNYFLKGNIPSEKDFHDFIDSCVNKIDDGIIKVKGEGIKILADGPNKELFNFFDNIDDLNPTWVFNQKTEDGNEGLNISVGSTKPSTKLEVAGLVGMEGRIGNFSFGEIPANGEWHDVISDLNEYQAFEIVASVGKKGAHSILHAIAVSTYGKSKSKISKTCGHYGWSRNKLDVRWFGSYFSYQLQIRTKSNYGEGIMIKYNISKLY